MSRSFKRHPICSDGTRKTTKEVKRIANKAVRNAQNLPNGKAYKKVFQSYDIHDYISRWSWLEAKKEWETKEHWQHRFPTLKEFHKFWAKYYKRK